MRRQVMCVATVVLMAGTAAASVVLACGDKFLVPARGSRFQRPAAKRPSAAILVYRNPATDLGATLGNLDAEATLRKAGFRPSAVTSTPELTRALAAGGWDVVLAAVSDAAEVRQLSGADGPLVLPVLRNPTRAQLEDVRVQYAVVLKAPTKHQAFLDVVDEAVDVRTRAIKRQ